MSNATVVASQQYHFDGEDRRQLKLFINVWEHNMDHGPLTFYPASISDKILQRVEPRLRRDKGAVRFDDSIVVPAAGEQAPIRVMGPQGSGVFVDTSRCIHFGSRCNTKDRLMLLVQFAPHNLARESSISRGDVSWIPFDRSDELQRLALRAA